VNVEPSDIEERVHRVAGSFGSLWPMHSFVTANPLAGYEKLPFQEAVRRGRRLYGGRGYPRPKVFRRAWEEGNVDREFLADRLEQAGYEEPPSETLDRLQSQQEDVPTSRGIEDADSRLDPLMAKWLAAFVDQGTAHWPMPHREDGFYQAIRRLGPHDGEIPRREEIEEWPDDPHRAIAEVLSAYAKDRWDDIIQSQLASLPGWTGYIKQREGDGDAWQQTHPITLVEYLAVRLKLAELLEVSIAPDRYDAQESGLGRSHLGYIWLEALERGYRGTLIEALEADVSQRDAQDDTADAQLVFCIDTRSEIIRRHIEAAGDYETHGYAGFFGIPMEYQASGTDVSVEACPPIVDAQHRIVEEPADCEPSTRDEHANWDARHRGTFGVIDALKSNPATAFSFVESAGIGYCLALAARTLMPDALQRNVEWFREEVPQHHDVHEPVVDRTDADPSVGMSLDEQVDVAESAFRLMGWQSFSRLVVFVGHAAETANNPYDSSLDCGACAANPGGPSARVLAKICQKDAVRDGLEQRGIDIPEDTVFVAGEHNTTTDHIRLFDGHVPDSHREELEQLRADLDRARAGAADERAEMLGRRKSDGVAETRRRAADWAETRPEWGLAGNAAFVIGPRSWTDDLDLSGRCFLHSYDWTTDAEGEALEGILTGPMVVTQWINNQYYFSTVDNAVYGGGSKITQNPVGNIGVYQGNGGDLMMGLPLQSLYAADDEAFHQPIRLTTVVEAPVSRVTEILGRHDHLVTLLDNNWLYLTVVDPTEDRARFTYTNGLHWRRHDARETGEEPARSAVAHQS
jgi:hypothetical protein